MKQIWKFALNVTDEQVIEMPMNADILSLQVQHGVPCIWAIVSPNEPKKQSRRFRTIGTGHDFKPSGKFIGTYQLQGGSLVFHVFEF